MLMWTWKTNKIRRNIANNMKRLRIWNAFISSRIHSNTSSTTMRNLPQAKSPIRWDWINLPIWDQKNVSVVVYWRNKTHIFQRTHPFSNPNDDKLPCILSEFLFICFFSVDTVTFSLVWHGPAAWFSGHCRFFTESLLLMRFVSK